MIKTIKISKNTIEGTNRRKAIYKNAIVSFERVNNDINGNPLYRVYPVNFTFRHNKQAYRNYEFKGYYLVQSYYIEKDIAELIQCMLDTYYCLNFPKIDKNLLDESYFKYYL